MGFAASQSPYVRGLFGRAGNDSKRGPRPLPSRAFRPEAHIQSRLDRGGPGGSLAMIRNRLFLCGPAAAWLVLAPHAALAQIAPPPPPAPPPTPEYVPPPPKVIPPPPEQYKDP